MVASENDPSENVFATGCASLRHLGLARLMRQMDAHVHGTGYTHGGADFAGFSGNTWSTADRMVLDWKAAWSQGLIRIASGLDSVTHVRDFTGGLGKIVFDIVYAAPLSGAVRDDNLMQITFDDLRAWALSFPSREAVSAMGGRGARISIGGTGLSYMKAREMFLALMETLLLYQSEGRIVDYHFIRADRRWE